MKRILFLLVMVCALNANAQNYLITFAGAGASTIVNTVKVENLMTGTTLSLSGNDILHLTGTTGINSFENKQSSEIKIYPNPMTENSIIEVYPPVAGDVLISIYGITGKLVFQIPDYLENSRQEFHLSGINSGIYLISVKGSTYQYSGKFLCNGNSTGNIKVEKIENDQGTYEKISKTEYQGSQTIFDMLYTTGDRLKFTAVSGNFSTVMTDILIADKTATFNFVACSDGEKINYPVVMIGDQIWMEENLRTTKYTDGSTSIPLVIDNTAWCELITPGYCWYKNDEASYKVTYGALYNWYAVTQGNICPTGWHVPTDADWTTLATTLGGASFAGGKLKETGTAHWISPNTDATNETGFTALPGGDRTASGGGAFVSIGTGGLWWSTAETGTGNAWCWFMGHAFTQLGKVGDKKQTGYSVRCIKDK
jgi:uncharacterized protein (TIGR02145 family)